MSNTRRNKLMWRWSLVAAGFIALFWAVHFLIEPVPMATVFEFRDEANSVLRMSRWWDILIGPACVIPAILIFAQDRKSKSEKTVYAMPGAIIIGLATSWLIITTQDTRNGLLLIALYGFSLGLAGLWWGRIAPEALDFAMISGLTCCLTSAVVSGFGIGFTLAVTFITASGVAIFATAVLVGFLEDIEQAYERFYKWLMAEGED